MHPQASTLCSPKVNPTLILAILGTETYSSNDSSMQTAPTNEAAVQLSSQVKMKAELIRLLLAEQNTKAGASY